MKSIAPFIGLGAAILAAAAFPPAARASAAVSGVPGFLAVATLLGPAPPTQQLHLVLHLPYPNPATVQRYAQAVADPSSPTFGKYLSPSQFTATFGPSPKSYSTVEYVATNAGMQVVGTYANRKVVDVVGTVAQAELLFGTLINQYSLNNVIYYANGTPAELPAQLSGTLMAVSGFTNFALQVAQPPSVGTPTGYGPLDIQRAYKEPVTRKPRLTGAGLTVAIETAYDYADSDISGFWNAYGIKHTGTLQRVLVNDPVNQGLPPPALTDETTLDVEQTTSSAPGANVLVYEAADTLNSTFDDVYEATVNNPRIDVVTTSFGQCEAGADPYEVAADNDLFEQAASQGQTRFAAAGDNGAQDCGQNSPPFGWPGFANPNTVDFPASSPSIAAAGGTTLQLGSGGQILSEVAWSGSGGGLSALFAKPVYQAHVAHVIGNHRNVPDVALNADPNTPYAFFYNGSFAMTVAGTSAVAPNLAALYAQIDQFYGRRQGLAQTGLYAAWHRNGYPGAAFNDITQGSNNGYSAHSGYDQVTGAGSLNGYVYMLQIPQPARQGIHR